MSYEPTVWKKGDIVTSEKLNKIENGIANCGNIMVVNYDPEVNRTDKTWQEIYDAAEMKTMIVLFNSSSSAIIMMPLAGITIDSESSLSPYQARFGSLTFYAD